MKNTVLNFESRKVVLDGEEFEVPDYFSKNYNVHEFFENLPNRADYYITNIFDNNDKLERIQVELYKNENYWDIIMLINDMDQIFSMPLEDEYNYEEIDRMVDRYFDEIFYRKYDNNREQLGQQFEDDFLEQANKRKPIRYIHPHRMGDFLSRLKRQDII